MPRKRKCVTAAQQRERNKKQQNASIVNPLQSHQELSNLIHKDDTCTVISGTLHQGDTRFQYPGIQCAYISLIALIRMTHKDPKLWTSEHIDSCVIDGNSMFLKHFEELNIQPKMLMATELPKIVNFSNKSFVCTQSESDIEVGLLNSNVCSVNESPAKSIDNALLDILKSSHTCLLFSGGQTIAIAKVNANFYAFDPHSRGKDGMLHPNGSAVLIVFGNLNDLVRYIKELFLGSLKLGPAEQFELVPLHILQQSIEISTTVTKSCCDNRQTVEAATSYLPDTLETSESISNQQQSCVERKVNNFGTSESIESYFEDQERRQKLFQEGLVNKPSTVLHKRNEYMKNYMKKRREKDVIRKRENEATRSRMQNVRSTSKGKQSNKERSAEGMRKYIETEQGRKKHNKLSAETMKKRLCTPEARLKHNKRSAESMRNMLKDDKKRLKHREKSSEALRKMLLDEEKRQKHKENSVDAMRRLLKNEQKKQRHNEKSVEAMRRMLTDERKKQKHKDQSNEALKRMLTDEQKKLKRKEQKKSFKETKLK